MQFAVEVLGAEQEQHLTINNLLLFWPCVCVRLNVCVRVCCLYVCFLGAPEGSWLVFIEAVPRLMSCSNGSGRCHPCSLCRCFIIHRHTLLAMPNDSDRSGNYSTAVRSVCLSMMSLLVWPFVCTLGLHLGSSADDFFWITGLFIVPDQTIRLHWSVCSLLLKRFNSRKSDTVKLPPVFFPRCSFYGNPCR